MNKQLSLLVISACFAGIATAQVNLSDVVFSQDFNDVGGVLADYVDSTVAQSNTSHFTSTDTDDATIQITGNRLEMTNTSTDGSDRARIFRGSSTDHSGLQSAPLEIAQLQFVVNITNSGTKTPNSTSTWGLGNDFNRNDARPPAESEFFMAAGHRLFDDKWVLRVSDIGASTEVDVDLTEGTDYQITLVGNDSGNSIQYTNPNGALATLADNSFDVWYGTVGAPTYSQVGSKSFSALSTSTMTQLTLGTVNIADGLSTTLQFDDIEVTTIPEPSSLFMLIGGFAVLVAGRKLFH